VASLDIQDAPFVPPRFEPWRLMERIIANCAAVCIWVGGACRADALQARAGTHTDATCTRCFRSCSMVRADAAVQQARDTQSRLPCVTRATCVSGTKSTSTCCRLSALTTPVAGAGALRVATAGQQTNAPHLVAAAHATDASRAPGASVQRTVDHCCDAFLRHALRRYKIAFILVGLAGQFFTRCAPASRARARAC
jgi:hypothetical protein